MNTTTLNSVSSTHHKTSVLQNLLKNRAVVESGPVDDPTVMKKDRNGDVRYAPLPGALWVEGAEYDDIRQGQIGDCYFMASLSAVAKANPGFLSKSIRLNADGTYPVRFFKKGKPVYVRVDNDFPQKNGRPIYGSSSDSGELWVAVMEKAYAKLNNGYEKIGKGGWPENALQTITGIDAKNYSTGVNAANLYARIQGAVQGGSPITAGTGQNENIAASGLVPSHAYTVVGARVQNGQQYVSLRNPWGFQEWNGGGGGVNDGIFEMPIEEFQK